MSEFGQEATAGPLAGRGPRFLRQGSSFLAGGTMLIPPETPPAPEVSPPATEEEGERQPILRRQASRRMQTQQQVVTRLAEETWKRWWPLFALMFLTLLCCYGVMFYYTILHFLAVCNNWTKPCDQPLHYYLFAQFVISFINSQFTGPKLVARYGPNGIATSFVVGVVLGWATIAWGLCMVRDCKTCQNTNPELYTTARDYIKVQIIFSIVVSLIVFCMSMGAMRFWSMWESRMHPGCPSATAKMTTVAPDAGELIDLEDGKVMDCPICQDALNATGTTVLRTDCDHHFHKACLEKWLKSHLDCPMCRTELGPPDNEVPSDNEVPV